MENFSCSGEFRPNAGLSGSESPRPDYFLFTDHTQNKKRAARERKLRASPMDFWIPRLNRAEFNEPGKFAGGRQADQTLRCAQRGHAKPYLRRALRCCETQQAVNSNHPIFGVDEGCRAKRDHSPWYVPENQSLPSRNK
jgi:hypothetical protein